MRSNRNLSIFVQTIVVVAAINVPMESVAHAVPQNDFANQQQLFLQMQGDLLYNGNENFETLLPCHSRSIAIASPDTEYSFYDFSVPGIGARNDPLSLKPHPESRRRRKNVALAPFRHNIFSGTERTISEIAALFNAPCAAIDTATLERMVRPGKDNKVRFAYPERPLPRRRTERKNVKAYPVAIRNVLSRFPDTTYYTFSDLVYDDDLFIDPQYLNDIGGKNLNEDCNSLNPSKQSDHNHPK